MNNKKLYRTEDNKMLAGVCGGVAEYFNLDPTLVRVLWVAVSLFAGAGADSGHSVAADELHLEAGGGAAQCYGAYPRRQSGGEG